MHVLDCSGDLYGDHMAFFPKQDRVTRIFPIRHGEQKGPKTFFPLQYAMVREKKREREREIRYLSIIMIY